MDKKEKLSYNQKMLRMHRAGVDSSVVNCNDNGLLPISERVKNILGILESGALKSTEMIFFVMYDIENDKVRNQIAKYLIRKGCHRVQKSIFIARLDRSVYDDMATTLLEVQELYENNDSIILVPVSTDEMRAMKIIGDNIDFDLVMGNKNVLFF